MLQDLFSGSRFLFWVLAPILVGSGVLFLVVPGDGSPVAVAVSGVLALLCFVTAVALFDPSRCALFARIATAIVFLAYLAFVVDTYRVRGPGERAVDPKDRSNSLTGLTLIGLPCLAFTLSGFRRDEGVQEPDDDPEHEHDEPSYLDDLKRYDESSHA